MQILTSTGYKAIEDVTYDDLLVAYDVNTGNIIYNHLEKKELWTKDVQGVDHNLDWINYKINDTWTVFKYQSIWVNENRVVHGSDLQVGDYVYDDSDQPIQIYKIEEVEKNEWWRLNISGDHSYIADNLTYHNESRYWVGGGSSVNWNATSNTNWSSSSGGANNASVPTSVDDVIFDGNGVNANGNNTVSVATTVLSFTRQSGFTATITRNANLTVTGNVIIDSSAGFAWSGNSNINLGGSLALGGTIASGGKPFRSVGFNAGTFTLSGGNDLDITGTLSVANNNSTINSASGERWILGTTGVINFSFFGNAEAIYTGTNVNFQGFTNFTISAATSSTIVAFQNLFADGGTIKLARGILVPSGVGNLSNRGLIGGLTSIFDLSGSTLRNFSHGNTGRVSIFTSPVNFSGTTTFSFATATISGTGVVTTATLSNSTSTTTIDSASTLVVTGALISNSTRVTPGVNTTIQSSSATARATLTLSPGATCNTNSSFTRIDASRGRPINTFLGATVSDCVNIRSFTDIPTKANTYFIN